MKKHWGKVLMLSAAMLVTVPSAAFLSACGSEPEHKAESAWSMDAENHWHNCTADAKDEHKFDLGAHDWEIKGEIWSCKVCGYTKSMVDISDAQVRLLQTALQNMYNYRGAVTAQSVSTGANLLEEKNGNISASFDPDRGIGYTMLEQGDEKEGGKIFQDGNRFIEYEFATYRDEDTGKLVETGNYALVDKDCVRHMLYDEVESENTVENPNYQYIYGMLFNLEWNRNMLHTGVSALMDYIVGEDLSVSIDYYQIAAVTQNNLMTVTITMQGSPKDTLTAAAEDYDQSGNVSNVPDVTDVSGKVKFTIDTNKKTMVQTDMQTQITGIIDGQTAVQNIHSATNFTVDQTAYDKIATGTLPAKIDIKMSSAQVKCQIFQDANNETDNFYLAVPYNTEITAANIDNYTDQLKNIAAEYCGVALSKVQVKWTNDDFSSAYSGNCKVLVYPDLCQLYARVTIANN